jgi:DNA-binding beta-propeller fold protein YncE
MRNILIAAGNILLLAVPVAAQPYLYILSSGYTCSGRGCDTSRIADARVVVLDARTHRKVSTITLPGTGAQRMAFAPDGSRLFITMSDRTLIVVDTATNRILWQVDVSLGEAVSSSPTSVVVAPDGSRVFLAAGRLCVAAPCDDVHNPGMLLELDAATGTILRTADVARNPWDVLLSPSGQRAYVSSPESARVTVVDTDRMLPVASVATAATPLAMAIDPDGGRLYVATGTTTADGEVTVVSTATNTIEGHIFVSSSVPNGGTPIFAMTITPDGSRLLLARPNAVTTIDTAQAAVSGTVAILPAPVEFAYGGRIVALGNTTAYATRAYGTTDLIAGVNVATGAVVQVPATLDAVDIAVAPDTLRPPRSGALVIDAPSFGATVTQPFTIGGWALAQGATTPPGVDAIHVWAYPASGAAPIFAGSAPYGGTRPDVAALFGPEYLSTGFTLQVRGLPDGRYLFAVFAWSHETGAFDVVASTSATVVSNVSDPWMNVDVPAADATVSSRFAIGGWALDRGASDSRVDAVHVWAYPDGNGVPLFVGAAARGPRPDLAAIFNPGFEMAGFHLKGSLPAGTYLLAVFARSMVTGTFNNVRAFRIVVTSPSLRITRTARLW